MNRNGTGDNIFQLRSGGCYAKTINLTEEKEPEIFGCLYEVEALVEIRLLLTRN
jgi:ATP-dependent phosphoenolpyruvate carboxykinase